MLKRSICHGIIRILNVSHQKPKPQNTHEAKTGSTQSRNRVTQNYSWGLQHSPPSQQLIELLENQQQRRPEQHNHQDLINRNRTLCPTTAEYTFFNEPGHILGHKTNISIFKRIEIIHSAFSNNNGIKLEINNKKRKTCKHMKIKQLPLNKPCVKQEVSREIKQYPKLNRNKNMTYQFCRLQCQEKTLQQ